MNIKGAIFDMDGTLIDSLMFWDVLWEEMGEKYHNDKTFRPGDNVEKAIRTMTLVEACELIHKECKIGESSEDIFNFTNEAMKRFYSTRIKLKEGVWEYLEHLKNNGVKMCIASATARELLMIAAEYLDITKYFDKILSCADIGKGKDQPDIYLLALETLGTDKESTWIFEDSFVALNTAVKLGLHTVGIYDKYNFDKDKVKELATKYIADGESFTKLI